MSVSFPVVQKDYRKIETNEHININVFGYEKQEPYPVHISKEKFNDMLNLLLITNLLCTRQRLRQVYVQPNKTRRQKAFLYALFAVFPL